MSINLQKKKKVPEVLQLFIPASLSLQVEAPTANSALLFPGVHFHQHTTRVFYTVPKTQVQPINTGLICWLDVEFTPTPRLLGISVLRMVEHR